MGEIWSEFSTVIKLQGLIVAVLITVALVIGQLGSHQGYERIAFAIPAAKHSQQRWADEVDAFGTRVSRAFGVGDITAREFASWILEASTRQHIDPELLASLVHTESTFRKQAVSHVGAIGPAQVRPEMWSQFCGSSNLVDPAENIYCGAQVLSHLRERCGGDLCALKAYNIGMYSKKLNAASRYVAKIDRAREQLRSPPL